MARTLGSKQETSALVKKASGGTRRARAVARPDINLVVGSVLHRLRVASGLSQTAVAKAIGLTFQQVQKYERGTNKISLATLILLSDYFKVPLATFTDPAEAAAGGDPALAHPDEYRQPTSRVRLELGRELNEIRDEALLRPILDLLRTINGDHRGDHGGVDR